MLALLVVAQAARKARVAAALALFHAAEITLQTGMRLYLGKQTELAGLRRIWAVAHFLERLACFAAFGHPPRLHRRTVRRSRRW